MSRATPTRSFLLPGPAGLLDLLVDEPAEARGIAVVCHPHPLYGGANTNKVVHTLARSLRDLGYVALRPNFRGVGQSGGTHDGGPGETDDMLAVIDWAQSEWGELPLVLGGFSFGAFVQVCVANRLAGRTQPFQYVFAGMAAGEAQEGERSYATPNLPQGCHGLLIHGEQDNVIPLGNVFDWARPQGLPVVVVPGAGHFFHGRLNLIRDWVARNIDPPA